MYSDQDTDWATSAKGNEWRRINGVVLVIGRRKTDGQYWAMRDGEFLKGSFATEVLAKSALERKDGPVAGNSKFDDEEWEI